MAIALLETDRIINDNSTVVTNGYVYFGRYGTDPKLLANRITVYSDETLKTEINNPVRTDSFGRLELTPYVGEDFSYAIYLGDDTTKIEGPRDRRIPTKSKTFESEVGLSKIATLDLSSYTFANFDFWATKGDRGRARLYKTGGTTTAGKLPTTSPYGTFGDAAGNEFAFEKTNPIPAPAFGIVPDGSTDYRANGYLSAFLQFSANNNCWIRFTPGNYACALDNYYSNVRAISDPGANFYGTIHYAINDSATTTPSSNRPKNVVFLGTWSTYDRIGAYNSDDVYLERGIVLDDSTKSLTGVRGGGVHLYQQCYNHTIDELIVYSSERDYGIGIDANALADVCRGVTVNKATVYKTHTHGVLLVGDCSIGYLRVVDFAVAPDTSATGKTTASLPLFTSPTADGTTYRGLAIGDSWTGRIGKAVVQNGTGFGCENVNGSDGSMIELLDISSGSSHGLLNRGTLNANKITVRSSAGRGIWNLGTINVEKVYANSNANNVYLDGGTFNAQLVESRNDTAPGFIATANASWNIGKLTMVDTNSSNSGQAQCNFDSGQGHIGFVEITVTDTVAKETAGIYYASTMTALNIDHLKTVGCGSTGKVYGAIQVADGAANLHVNGLNMTTSSQAALRMPGVVTDCSFANGKLDTIQGVSASLTRLGFMNVNNTGTTNISGSGVATFNCVGVV